MRDLENQDKVHWMRAFSSLEEQTQLKKDFYEGPVWNKEVEPVAMSMIEEFCAEFTETTDGFEGFQSEAL
ncbi:hypothetical protein [Pseudoalteromonas luteoviolacea]|nr:hypothetical protein [Pseudoalteromonas luteoviolacea]